MRHIFTKFGYIIVVAYMSFYLAPFSIAQDVKEECEASFITGEFILDNQAENVWKLKRKKNKQIEYSKSNKQKIISSIEWISKTEYILTVKRYKGPEGLGLKKGTVLKCEILKCWDQSFLVETIMDGYPSVVNVIKSI